MQPLIRVRQLCQHKAPLKPIATRACTLFVPTQRKIAYCAEKSCEAKNDPIPITRKRALHRVENNGEEFMAGKGMKKKGVNLVYRVDIELSEQEVNRLKEILKYATLSEIARMDASRDLKATVLDTVALGGSGLGSGGTIGFMIA
jgi:hypothetical protein